MQLKLSTHSICIALILTFGNLTYVCGFLNIRNFELAELSHNLFTFNRRLLFVNSLLNILFLLRLLTLTNNVVSSAYTLHSNNLLEKNAV